MKTLNDTYLYNGRQVLGDFHNMRMEEYGIEKNYNALRRGVRFKIMNNLRERSLWPHIIFQDTSYLFRVFGYYLVDLIVRYRASQFIGSQCFGARICRS